MRVYYFLRIRLHPAGLRQASGAPSGPSWSNLRGQGVVKVGAGARRLGGRSARRSVGSAGGRLFGRSRSPLKTEGHGSRTKNTLVFRLLPQRNPLSVPFSIPFARILGGCGGLRRFLLGLGGGRLGSSDPRAPHMPWSNSRRNSPLSVSEGGRFPPRIRFCTRSARRSGSARGSVGSAVGRLGGRSAGRSVGAVSRSARRSGGAVGRLAVDQNRNPAAQPES